MPLYCAARAPIALLAEPDEAIPCHGQIDGTALLTPIARVGDWIKVARSDVQDAASTGWVPLATLRLIEPSERTRIILFPEPLSESWVSLDARVARVLVAVANWRKVQLLLDDGAWRIGWTSVPETIPGPGGVPDVLSNPGPREPVGLLLGVNGIYLAALQAARTKANIDPAALAALVDAEAGTIRAGPQKGQWDPRAFNSSSGAAGLTQFLASTWLGHAATSGTELNLHASRTGLTATSGEPMPGRKDELLALRFDPALSIVSAAEYGAINLRCLIKRGLIEPAMPDDRKAWFMYLAHHEGLGGATGFLNGSTQYTLAKLTTQVGAAKAAELCGQHGGDANQAYRDWLTRYIDRKIQPAKFRMPGAAPRMRPPQPDIGATPEPGSVENGAPEEVKAYASLGREAGLILESFAGPALPFEQIGGQQRLGRALQEALSVAGYLDPPADGEFGPVSIWALAQFGRRLGLDVEAGLTAELARALTNPAGGLPQPVASGTWVDPIISAMQRSRYFVCRHPDCWNIVYVEGMGIDGTLNDDRPDAFNDLRLVFRITDSGIPEFHCWEATTEPGNQFTFTPENSAGAARIAFRQFKSWSVGLHPSRRDPKHEALVQTKPVTVHRDFNKDHMRTGDRLDRGLFGINQHWGYDLPAGEIRNASAGCLVGRSTAGHREFMALLKKDARYRASKGYRFVAAILAGDRLQVGQSEGRP